jgi:hypothetical protein
MMPNDSDEAGATPPESAPERPPLEGPATPVGIPVDEDTPAEDTTPADAPAPPADGVSTVVE